MSRMMVIISFIVLIAVARTGAQTVYNSTTLHVTGQGLLHLPAGFVNAGYCQNNGTIVIDGDWTNANIYNGSGTIRLAGSAQRFANMDQSIEMLEIEGGDIKLLTDIIVVNKKLTLNDGVIQFTGAGNLQLAADATIIGGSERSYVEGPLAQEGVGYKFFPVGKNGRYRPFELLDIAGITPNVSVELMENVPQDLVVEGCEKVFRDFYWKRETISGQFFTSPVSAVYTREDVQPSERVAIIQSKSFNETFSILVTDQITGPERNGNIIFALGADGNLFLLASIQAPPEVNEPEYYFSSTLSPNASNSVNHQINIFGDYLVPEDFHFVIFNRQGLIVFETHSLQQMEDTGWNGAAANGSMLGAGAYPYTFQATTIKGKLIQQKGIISLIK